MKKLTLNETEKDILIRALTRFLLTDQKESDRETAGIMLMALKKL
jgi:hypothetical protein